MTEPEIGEMFASLFGRSPGLSADIAVSLELTDEEAATGVTREVAFTRTATCTGCEGRGGSTPDDVLTPCTACAGKGERTRTQGFFTVRTPCEACRGRGATVVRPCATCAGTGTVPVPATTQVTVPAGALPGTVMRLEGQGNTLIDGTRGALVVWLLIGDAHASQLADVQAAFTRMMIEPNVPRAIVRTPRERGITPPQILALVVGVILVLIGLAR